MVIFHVLTLPFRSKRSFLSKTCFFLHHFFNSTSIVIFEWKISFTGDVKLDWSGHFYLLEIGRSLMANIQCMANFRPKTTILALLVVSYFRKFRLKMTKLDQKWQNLTKRSYLLVVHENLEIVAKVHDKGNHVEIVTDHCWCNPISQCALCVKN